MSFRKKMRAQREVVYRKRAGHRPYQSWRTRPNDNHGYSEEDKRLWRQVDGAVADAYRLHPDYLTEKGQSGAAARHSVVKRVVGVIRASRKRGAVRVDDLGG